MPRYLGHWETQTEPAQEPVSVDQARTWLKQSDTDATIRKADEMLISHVLIPAARRLIERWTGRALITQTVDLWLDKDQLVGKIPLPRAPFSALDSSETAPHPVDYWTEAHVETAVDSDTYYTSGNTDQPFIALDEGESWPTDPRDYDAMRIRYDCGYGAGVIGTPAFVGSGLDDLTTGGTYCGSKNITYRIAIQTAAATDVIKWSRDAGVTWVDSSISVTGDYQLLENGLYVKLAATTGHTAGEYWTVACTGHGVPEVYTTAILATVGDWYNRRGNLVDEDRDIPAAVKAMLPRTVKI